MARKEQPDWDEATQGRRDRSWAAAGGGQGIPRRSRPGSALWERRSRRSAEARFFNEARAVNIIQHPGLVGVFESGRLEDGAAYIVMEYLEGELLSMRLQKAVRLPLRTALTLGRQIASALAAAHSKRIVHRDLKPDIVGLKGGSGITVPGWVEVLVPQGRGRGRGAVRSARCSGAGWVGVGG